MDSTLVILTAGENEELSIYGLYRVPTERYKELEEAATDARWAESDARKEALCAGKAVDRHSPQNIAWRQAQAERSLKERVLHDFVSSQEKVAHEICWTLPIGE